MESNPNTEKGLQHMEGTKRDLVRTWVVLVWMAFDATPFVVALMGDSIVLTIIAMIWAGVVTEITRILAPEWLRKVWECLSDEEDDTII